MELYKVITEEDKNKISVFDTDGVLDYTEDKFTLIQGIVKQEDEVIALGIGRIVNEFKISINPKFSNFQVAKAIKTLFEEAMDWAKKFGSNEILVIITKGGENYENLLIKHFGFEKVSGTPLRGES
ncbi:MAG: hypothetical protein WD512_10040 [Candidatus Paceibacterota bacterium]